MSSELPCHGYNTNRMPMPLMNKTPQIREENTHCSFCSHAFTPGHSWQEAAAREVLEETELGLDPADIRLLDVHSAPDGTVLIFGLAKQISADEIPPFAPNNEVSKTAVFTAPTELAFPLHSQAVARFFKERTAARQIDT